MSVSLLDEYVAWIPGSKIELVNKQLIVGDSLTKSYLLLSQILRGWGIDALVALAPETLWWEALAQTFGTPKVTSLDALDVSPMQHWASQVKFSLEIPKPEGSWRWADSELRSLLRMAMFGLGSRYKKLGQSLGGGFVNRLGRDALMPDVLFFRGQPRNELYEYYLNGPAEVIVEFVQPGCEDYIHTVKRSRYEAAGVPELWIIDQAHQQIDLLCLVEGCYQRQQPDVNGGYAVSSIPGLTFFPEKLWLSKDEREFPPESALFQVLDDASRIECIHPIGNGVDQSRGLLKFPVRLEPVPIFFEDYIYWCPEAKFEFVDGRPDIGGREGIKGLTGMLLMTFGLVEVIKLAHPRDWIDALLKIHYYTTDPDHKTAWWKLARDTAAFLREHFEIERIAVAGDLVSASTLNFWSELVLVVWQLPLKCDRYSDIDCVIQQLSQQPRIRLVDASERLTEAQQQLLEAGIMEL